MSDIHIRFMFHCVIPPIPYRERERESLLSYILVFLLKTSYVVIKKFVALIMAVQLSSERFVSSEHALYQHCLDYLFYNLFQRLPISPWLFICESAAFFLYSSELVSRLSLLQLVILFPVCRGDFGLLFKYFIHLYFLSPKAVAPSSQLLLFSPSCLVFFVWPFLCTYICSRENYLEPKWWLFQIIMLSATGLGSVSL